MPTSVSCLTFFLPLLALLGGCSVFHSGQKDKLRMPAKMEAEYKAKEKARHKGLTYKPTEESSSGGAAKDAKETDPKKPLSYSDLPEGTRRKYDKNGLVKDHLPAPNARHTYERFAFKGTEVNEESRKLRKKGKKNKKDNDSAPGKTKDAAAPAGKEETPPAEAPKAD